MKYTKPAAVEYPDYDPEGGQVSGFVTVAVDGNGTFDHAVRALVLKETNRTYGYPDVLMTTREHWSGYSEYTITNTWSEIILTVPAWNWEHEWPSLGDFLRALADANPEADRWPGFPPGISTAPLPSLSIPPSKPPKPTPKRNGKTEED